MKPGTYSIRKQWVVIFNTMIDVCPCLSSSKRLQILSINDNFKWNKLTKNIQNELFNNTESEYDIQFCT